MKKRTRIIKITEKKAQIEIPSLKSMLRVPLDILNKFAEKKVKITIEVKK